jgi:hypothetical protein
MERAAPQMKSAGAQAALIIVPCLVLVAVDLPSAIRLRDNLDRSAAAATQCVVDDQN